MPVFLSMTHGLNDEQRTSIVKRATFISFIILVVFTVCGQLLFSFFGISTNGFRIAAGCIIFKIGFDMLLAKYKHDKMEGEEAKTYANDISITPLAIPMLCGPAAIANGIMLMDNAESFIMKCTLIGMIALIYIIAFLILKWSTKLIDFMGQTGINVMMRLMGLIIMVIAVECLVGGLRPIVIEVIRTALSTSAA